MTCDFASQIASGARAFWILFAVGGDIFEWQQNAIKCHIVALNSIELGCILKAWPIQHRLRTTESASKSSNPSFVRSLEALAGQLSQLDGKFSWPKLSMRLVSKCF